MQSAPRDPIPIASRCSCPAGESIAFDEGFVHVSAGEECHVKVPKVQADADDE